MARLREGAQESGGLEPAVDLDQLAEVIRLAFPPAATAAGAGVTA